MVELDERMIHQYKIPLEKMMEHAGRGLAQLVQQRNPKAKRFVVLAGTGNNGGGGLVAARYLAEKGLQVRVILSAEEYFLKDVPKKQFAKLPESVMVGVSSEAQDAELGQLLETCDVVLEALLGYSVQGAATGEVARLITMAKKAQQIVSLDLPSGMDTDEGPITEPVMKATATLTIALPKEGLLFEDAQEYIGDLYVVDICVPDVWYKENEYRRPAYGTTGFVRVPLVPIEE